MSFDAPEVMSRRTSELDLGLPDPVPDDVAELFSKCQDKLGLIPNVLVAYAHRPEKLRAFSLMYNDLMLGPSGLSKLELAICRSGATATHDDCVCAEDDDQQCRH